MKEHRPLPKGQGDTRFTQDDASEVEVSPVRQTPSWSHFVDARSQQTSTEHAKNNQVVTTYAVPTSRKRRDSQDTSFSNYETNVGPFPRGDRDNETPTRGRSHRQDSLRRDAGIGSTRSLPASAVLDHVELAQRTTAPEEAIQHSETLASSVSQPVASQPTA